PDPLSPRALMGWAGGCQPWGRSASSAVAATPRRQTRCLLLLVEEALGGYAHVSQCEAPLPVALRLDLLLGGIATQPLSQPVDGGLPQLHFTSPTLVPIVSRFALRAGLATLRQTFVRRGRSIAAWHATR